MWLLLSLLLLLMPWRLPWLRLRMCVIDGVFVAVAIGVIVVVFAYLF